MIDITFLDKDLENFFQYGHCSNNAYNRLARDKRFYISFQNVVNTIMRTENIAELKNYSFLHYERLRYKNESSVRIVNGRVERLLFTENENGIEVSIIKIDETHYGNKK